MSAVNFPPVYTSSRTPLQSWTKRQRKEEKWVPRLYTLLPRLLGLFLLSCPHCECSASVLMSLGPIALSQFISTWAPFFLSFIFVFSHLTSHLCLPPLLSYHISTYLLWAFLSIMKLYLHTLYKILPTKCQAKFAKWCSSVSGHGPNERSR